VALTGRMARLHEDRLAEVLSGLPVLGCHLEAVSSMELDLTVYLSAEDAPCCDDVVQALRPLGVVALETRQVRDEDWLAAYRDGMEAFPVGRLWWVDPHPQTPSAAPPGRRRLVVEPRMAFGSGSHQSTRLVLLELERGTGERPGLAGKRILDVGTGSGILALAADRLRARDVVRLDIDPVAIRVAQRTAAEQEWTPHVRFVVGSTAALGHCSFDIVLCNMLPEEFLPLLGDLSRVLDRHGWIVLSGILEERREEVVASLGELHLSVMCEESLDEWCCLTVIRDGVGKP